MEDQWQEALAVYRDAEQDEEWLEALLVRAREQKALAAGAMCETGATHEQVAAALGTSRQRVGQYLAAAYRIASERAAARARRRSAA